MGTHENVPCYYTNNLSILPPLICECDFNIFTYVIIFMSVKSSLPLTSNHKPENIIYSSSSPLPAHRSK